MNFKKPLNFKLTLGFYFLTSLLRIAGATLSFFPMGFSPMESVSLFSTRLIQRRWVAYLFPLLIIVSTDSMINFFYTRDFSPFYHGFYWQYLSYFLVTLLGQYLLKSELSRRKIIFSCFASATLFFIVSNFGVFVSGRLYPMNAQGFMNCYVMALPFYAKDLCANLFFSFIIYAVFLPQKTVFDARQEMKQQVF